MFYLKRNLPVAERVIRVTLAACLAAALLVIPLPVWAQILVGACLATLVVTGLVGFCPACALLGRKRVDSP